jgi:hypothetical protein
VIQIATIRKNAREDLRVTLEEFRGHHLLNLRFSHAAEDGEQRPGKQGIAFHINLLPQLVKLLSDAEREARDPGLISGKAA